MASEYLRWKHRDVQPEKPLQLTPKQRRQNWWYYNKWYVLLGAAAVCIVGNLIWNAVTQVHPDYQIAYVAAVPLSEEQEADWESRLAERGTDCNGDGEVVVQLNQYLTLRNGGDAMYNYASNVKLMADLDACESYFFLLDDPEGFQVSYDILEPDWFPLENGLYLARRSFWENRIPECLDDCEILWNQLPKGVE